MEMAQLAWHNDMAASFLLLVVWFGLVLKEGLS